MQKAGRIESFYVLLWLYLGGQRLPDLLQRLLGKVPRLKVIFADGGQEGVPQSLMWRCFHVAVLSLDAPRRKPRRFPAGLPRLCRSVGPMKERLDGLADIGV